jgi:response regulator RpfG family c-di-GMP phosphodiesterase
MDLKILFVDDDPNILSAYTRNLRKRYRLTTASGGEAALQLVQAQGPFAVVVSDMQMPGMDGIELLTHVRNFSPDTVRIMLTGNADIGTAIKAVNQGNIFHFLTKPCESDDLSLALDAGIKQYQLVTSERELLEKTLKGSIDLLVELLSTLDPISFGRAQVLGERARRIAVAMHIERPWIVSLAAVLSQIGSLTVPLSVIMKARSGGLLNQNEREVLTRVPEIGSNLIRHIPRLEEVAEIILFMNKNFNGSGYPPGPAFGEQIPLGARILRVATDFQDLLPKKRDRLEAIDYMKSRVAWYDQKVVAELEDLLLEDYSVEFTAEPRPIPLVDLRVGHLLAKGIFTADGLLVVPEGTVLRASHMEKMRNFARISGLREPIWVIGPDPED